MELFLKRLKYGFNLEKHEVGAACFTANTNIHGLFLLEGGENLSNIFVLNPLVIIAGMSAQCRGYRDHNNSIFSKCY